MNSTVWTQAITRHFWPKWPCSTCKSGHLILDRDTFTHFETVESRHSQSDEASSLIDVEEVFSAQARCSNARCGERFVFLGNGYFEPVPDHEGNSEFEMRYKIKRCIPMPDIFHIIPPCPSEISRELRKSFSLALDDTQAASSRLRIALEILLDHLKIPKFRSNTPGKTSGLTLHARIEEFEKLHPTIGGQMMALKWLGNTGAHYSEIIISLTELLDAYSIMEHVLAETLGRRTAIISELATKISAKHRPK